MVFEVLVLNFPLSRADAQEEAGYGRLKPVTPGRDCFVFFHVEENEEAIYEKASRIDIISLDPTPEVAGLDQN
jgi:hypothetical protein